MDDSEVRTPKVFLSYAREDVRYARRLYLDLSTRGADVWIDSERLTGGQNWKLEIQGAIESSDYVVALLSTHSLSKRGFVQKELRLALDARDQMPEDTNYFIPVRVDDVPVRSPRIREISWIDAFGDWNRAVELLAITMKLRDAMRASGIGSVGPILTSPDATTKELDATARFRQSTTHVRTTFNLAPDAFEALKSFATERNVSVAETIRRAIHLDKYLTSIREDRGKILIEKRDGSVVEVVLA